MTFKKNDYKESIACIAVGTIFNSKLGEVVITLDPINKDIYLHVKEEVYSCTLKELVEELEDLKGLIDLEIY